VIDKLPERLKSVTEKRMRQAYHTESALHAEGLLTELAAELGETHPGAAASLREGMAETVKRWRDGTMALRWCAAGMIEVGRQFRRVNGHLHLPKLRDALNACFTDNVTTARQDQAVKAA
jgi:putative transposase